MQDKTGRDIFEGDIVRYAGRDLIVCFGYYDYYDEIEDCNVVGYGFYIKFVKTGNVRNFFELMDTHTELTTLVVGNIHQLDEYEKTKTKWSPKELIYRTIKNSQNLWLFFVLYKKNF